MQVTELELFPTKVLSIQFPDVEVLNRELYETFESVQQFQTAEYLAVADRMNLLALAEKHPCLGRLHGMFLDGLKRWLQSEKLPGDYTVDSLMFANYAQPGQYTIAHNHAAHVAGIYYVKTAPPCPADEQPRLGHASPWDQDNGVLYLFDPRFNASLVSLSEDHYFKVVPQPGQMILFPGSLWHSVTPNLERFRRLAISVNFSLEYREDGPGLYSRTDIQVT